jgi:5-methylcytosine-specific restriction endonuclease McrA
MRRRWRDRTRAKFLADHPLCEHCGRIATDVHHRVDIAAGGSHWAFENLQALCHSCHGRESMNRIER